MLRENIITGIAVTPVSRKNHNVCSRATSGPPLGRIPDSSIDILTHGNHFDQMVFKWTGGLQAFRLFPNKILATTQQ